VLSSYDYRINGLMRFGYNDAIVELAHVHFDLAFFVVHLSVPAIFESPEPHGSQIPLLFYNVT
jgi:hypothetical protein